MDDKSDRRSSIADIRGGVQDASHEQGSTEVSTSYGFRPEAPLCCVAGMKCPLISAADRPLAPTARKLNARKARPPSFALSQQFPIPLTGLDLTAYLFASTQRVSQIQLQLLTCSTLRSPSVSTLTSSPRNTFLASALTPSLITLSPAPPALDSPIHPPADNVMSTSTANEAQVLGELRARPRAVDAARTEACSTKDAVEIINAVRTKRNERTIQRTEVTRVLGLEPELLAIANDPFGPLPQSYATFVASVDVAQLDSAKVPDKPNRLELYERQVRFADFQVLSRRLEEACSAFPALEPRLAPLKDAVAGRIDRPGPAFLYYTGCCISGSPESRATDDFKTTGRLVSNLLSFWSIPKVDVYRVCLPDVHINPYEYRAARVWQLEEHTLIAMRYPLNLNSAPGGFSHEYRLDMYDPCPLPNITREPVPAAVLSPTPSACTSPARTTILPASQAHPSGSTPSRSSVKSKLRRPGTTSSAVRPSLLLARTSRTKSSGEITPSSATASGWPAWTAGHERRSAVPARSRPVHRHDGGSARVATTLHRPVHGHLPPLVLVDSVLPPPISRGGRMASGALGRVG